MLEKIHEILKDPACKEGIKCWVWGLTLTMFWMFAFFGLMIYVNYAWDFRDQINDLHREDISIKKEIIFLETNMEMGFKSIMPSALKGRK